MSDDWNPTLVSRDGEPVDTAEYEANRQPRYRDKAELTTLIERGLTLDEIADELDAPPSTVQHHMHRHDLVVDHDKIGERVRAGKRRNESLHRAHIGEDDTDADADTDVEDVDTATRCPECERRHGSPEAQQECLRSHARRRADRLLRQANAGEDVLSVPV